MLPLFGGFFASLPQAWWMMDALCKPWGYSPTNEKGERSMELECNCQWSNANPRTLREHSLPPTEPKVYTKKGKRALRSNIFFGEQRCPELINFVEIYVTYDGCVIIVEVWMYQVVALRNKQKPTLGVVSVFYKKYINGWNRVNSAVFVDKIESKNVWESGALIARGHDSKSSSFSCSRPAGLVSSQPTLF